MPPTLILFQQLWTIWLEDSKTSGRQEHASGNLRPEKKTNDVVFTEFTRYEIDHDGFGGLQIMRAVMSERYKLVIHLLDTDEFYDLQNDPYEMNNLINDETYARYPQ